jgi:hypothetical protein
VDIATRRGTQREHEALLRPTVTSLVSSAVDIATRRGTQREHEASLRPIVTSLVSSAVDIATRRGTQREHEASLRPIVTSLVSSAVDIATRRETQREHEALLRPTVTSLVSSAVDIATSRAIAREGEQRLARSQVDEGHGLLTRLQVEQEAVHRGEEKVSEEVTYPNYDISRFTNEQKEQLSYDLVPLVIKKMLLEPAYIGKPIDINKLTESMYQVTKVTTDAALESPTFNGLNIEGITSGLELSFRDAYDMARPKGTQAKVVTRSIRKQVRKEDSPQRRTTSTRERAVLIPVPTSESTVAVRAEDVVPLPPRNKGQLKKVAKQIATMSKISNILSEEGQRGKLRKEEVKLAVQEPTVNEWALTPSPRKYMSSEISRSMTHAGYDVRPEEVKGLWDIARMYTSNPNPETRGRDRYIISDEIHNIISDANDQGYLTLRPLTEEVLEQRRREEEEKVEKQRLMAKKRADAIELEAKKKKREKRQVVLAKWRKAFVTAAEDRLAMDRTALIKKFENVVNDMKQEDTDLMESLKDMSYSPFEMAARPPDVRAVLEIAQDIARQEREENVPSDISELERSTTNVRQLIDLIDSVDFRRIAENVNAQRILKRDLTSDDAKQFWIHSISSSTHDINKMGDDPEQYIFNAICDTLEGVRDVIKLKQQPDLPDEPFFFDDPQPTDTFISKSIDAPTESSVPSKKPKRRRLRDLPVVSRKSKKKSKKADDLPVDEPNVPVEEPNMPDPDVRLATNLIKYIDMYDAQILESEKETIPGLIDANMVDWRVFIETLKALARKEHRESIGSTKPPHGKGSINGVIKTIYNSLSKSKLGDIYEGKKSLEGMNWKSGKLNYVPIQRSMVTGKPIYTGSRLPHANIDAYIKAIYDMLLAHNGGVDPQLGYGKKRTKAPRTKKASRKEMDDIDARIMAILKK